MQCSACDHELHAAHQHEPATFDRIALDIKVTCVTAVHAIVQHLQPCVLRFFCLVSERRSFASSRCMLVALTLLVLTTHIIMVLQGNHAGLVAYQEEGGLVSWHGWT